VTPLSQRIRKLQDLSLTEDDIVQALDIPYLAYRKHAPDISDKLSMGARRELYYSDTREDSTLKDLAAIYRTSYSQVHQALYNKPKPYVRYSKELAMAHLQQHDSVELLAKDFKISKRALPQVLESLGWHYNLEDHRTPLASPMAKRILALIKDSPGLTYDQVATEIGCTRPYITHVAKSHGIHRKEMLKRDWSKILAYATQYGKASAARHFDVSRASIYYQERRAKKCK